MLGNQAIATVIGFVPVVGDIGIAVFKTNSRNAALLEEFLRIRGEEFLKDQADRVEDPEVVRPGAGKEETEKIPGKASSRGPLDFFRRSSKKVPTAAETPPEGQDGSEGKIEPKSNGKDSAKGKGKGKENSK